MRKILFICGSLNQTTMMHKISMQLPDYDCYFTPYYGHGYIKFLSDRGFLDFSILGGAFKQKTLLYLVENNLKIDYEGKDNDYHLVFTCSDLIIPENILNKKIILIQEGMTDPENLSYYLVKWLKLPRYMASTSVTGLSDAYTLFCVASEGFRDHFIRKGVNKNKIVVTGIPNFDDCIRFTNNNFPYKQFALVATSDARETFKFENRKKFIRKALHLAAGKQIIFKLHPNENYERAAEEINKYAPGSLVYHNHPIEEMIANCDILITKFSTVAFIGLALGKKVYSEFPIDYLKKLTPLQNNGTSASSIADVARNLIESFPNVHVNSGYIKNYKSTYFKKLSKAFH
jgi:hypothetical protein